MVLGVIKLLEQRTELTESAIEFLDSLVGSWALLADLALSDLVLWVPTWNEGGLLAVAQVRAATAPTTLANDLAGTFSPRGRNSGIDQAISLGRAMNPRNSAAPLIPLGVEAYPVRFEGQLIAVIARHASKSPRVAGQLEQVYLESADSLLNMLSQGLNWIVNDKNSLDSWDRPRVGDGLMRLDAQGVVDYASPNATSAFRRLGLATDLLGQRLKTLVTKLDESPTGPSRALELISEGGRSGVADIQGSDATIMLNAVALVGVNDEKSSRTIVILKDVTAVRAQQRVLLSKEAIIREINHRVKNNLQMVSSLLRLQARRAVQDETREALLDAQQRINAISSIHDVLSKDVVVNVDFDELIDSIILAAGGDSDFVTISRRGSGGNLPTAIATPLAMSLSELLHNALEHSQADVITLDVKRGDRMLECTVEDNGIGVTGDPGLGLHIVGDLVTKELRGEFGFEPHEGPGTHARIKISLSRSVPV